MIIMNISFFENVDDLVVCKSPISKSFDKKETTIYSFSMFYFNLNSNRQNRLKEPTEIPV